MEASPGTPLSLRRAALAGIAGLLTMVVFWIGLGWVEISWAFSSFCGDATPCPPQPSAVEVLAQQAFLVIAAFAPALLGGLIMRLVTLVRLGWPRTAGLTVLLAAIPVLALAGGVWVGGSGASLGGSLLVALGITAPALLGWAELARRASRGRPPALPTYAVPTA